MTHESPTKSNALKRPRFHRGAMAEHPDYRGLKSKLTSALTPFP